MTCISDVKKAISRRLQRIEQSDGKYFARVCTACGESFETREPFVPGKEFVPDRCGGSKCLKAERELAERRKREAELPEILTILSHSRRSRHCGSQRPQKQLAI